MLKQSTEVLRGHPPFGVGHAVQIASGTAVDEQTPRHVDLDDRKFSTRRSRQSQMCDDQMFYGWVYRVDAHFADEIRHRFNTVERNADDVVRFGLNAQDEHAAAGVGESGHGVGKRVAVWLGDPITGKPDLLDFKVGVFSQSNLVQQCLPAIEHPEPPEDSTRGFSDPRP